MKVDTNKIIHPLKFSFSLLAGKCGDKMQDFEENYSRPFTEKVQIKQDPSTSARNQVGKIINRLKKPYIVSLP